MRTDVAVILADTHVCAETGLLPPDAVGDDGAKLTQNRAQAFIWRSWQNCLARATADNRSELRNIHGGKKYLVHLGDILEGLHHDSTQIATLNQAAMRRIAAQTLRPWVAWCDYAFFLRGTPAHAGPAAADEESVAELLDAQEPGKLQRDPLTGMCTTFHRRIQIQDRLLDCAHHPLSGTGREYLAHSPAGTQAISTLLDYLLTGDQPPDVALRGHLHPRRGVLDSGLTYRTRAVICPSWKLIDEYGAKRTPGAVNVIGAVFCTVAGGHVDLWPVLYMPKRSKIWTEPTT